MNTENIWKYLQKYLDMAVDYLPRLLLTIVILIVGLYLIKWIIRLFRKLLNKRKTDPTLVPFLSNLLSWGLKIILFVTVIQTMGIASTSLVAIIGAVGLAVGFALQGTLANFAGGTLILIFKPYRVGHLIEAQGHLGVVKEIQIFTTILLTPENKTVILPNGAVSNGDITNYTLEGKLRVDLTMGISYDSNIKKAREVLMEVMKSDEHVLKNPVPFVGVVELADSSVNLAVRPWTTPEHYWDVYFGIYEKGKEALDKNDITIPFPQVDVHMDQ